MTTKGDDQKPQAVEEQRKKLEKRYVPKKLTKPEWDDRKKEVEKWVAESAKRGWIESTFVLPRKMEQQDIKPRLLYCCPKRRPTCMVMDEKEYEETVGKLEREEQRPDYRGNFKGVGCCHCYMPSTYFKRCIPSQEFQNKWQDERKEE